MQSIWNPFAVSGDESVEAVLEALMWLAKTTGKVAILTYGSLLLKASPGGAFAMKAASRRVI